MKKNLNIIDSWRYFHRNEVAYTYIDPSRRNRNSRIDYVLLSNFLNSCVKKAEIITSPAPDHKCVLIELDTSKRLRGKGYWQMNTSILKEENYLTFMKNIIIETSKSYKNEISARMLLDLIKFKIKENTIKYCCHRNKMKSDNIKAFEDRISTMDTKIAQNDSLTLKDVNYLKTSRCEYQEKLNQLYLERAEGARIRSKSKWLEKGEKNTGFFHKLEKQRQMNKRIDMIKNNEGELFVEDNKILNECKAFYENLYQSKNIDSTDINNFFNTVKMKKTLNLKLSHCCDGYITVTECYSALKLMGKNKSSGLDGIPTEFYLA